MVWGLGSGLHLPELAAKGQPLCVVALDAPSVEQAQQVIDNIWQTFQLQQARPELIAGNRREIVRALHKTANRFEAGEVQLHIHLAALHDLPPELSDIRDMLDRLTRERRKSKRVQSRLRSNLNRNLAAIAHATPLHSLQGLLGDAPVLVIGGGPSLDLLRFHWQHVARTHWLVAVDTAVPVLRASGIEPDFICTVDPNPESRAHFTKSPAPTTPAKLVFQPYALPEAVEHFEERVLSLAEQDKFCEQAATIVGETPLPTAGTVLLLALQCAQLLSRGDLVLVGADFAYVDNKTHASGTAHQRAVDKSIITLETWNGSSVPSSISLRSFRGAIVQALMHPIQARDGSARAWAIDGGGASIAGATPVAADTWVASCIAGLAIDRARIRASVRAPLAPDLAQQRRAELAQIIAELETEK